jgi:hypothetical protein
MHWPQLSYEEAKETYHTLHLWTQIVGKIKSGSLPWINHSWHVTLMVTPTGLTTGDLPAAGKHFQINFDFLDHQLQIVTSSGENRSFDLANLSVAEFYNKILVALKEFSIDAEINRVPNEMENVIPFDKDEEHATYNTDHAEKLHTVLLNANEVFTTFRAEFTGKCSPVHFFWGGFDLAVSRFSGNEAPPHPGGIPHLPDWIAREAYSHEVSSCGFWPGNESLPFAAFYSYIYPEPEGFKNAYIKPGEAYYHNDLREFILPYNDVRKSANPEQMLLDFLHTTYETAANFANWNRRSLEMQGKKTTIPGH